MSENNKNTADIINKDVRVYTTQAIINNKISDYWIEYCVNWETKNITIIYACEAFYTFRALGIISSFLLRKALIKQAIDIDAQDGVLHESVKGFDSIDSIDTSSFTISFKNHMIKEQRCNSSTLTRIGK